MQTYGRKFWLAVTVRTILPLYEAGKLTEEKPG
jgi:hypothetical protein